MGGPMRLRIMALAGAMIAASPALAQGVSVEDLARRVEALERENAALRAQVQQLADRPAPAPPVYSTPPAPAATDEDDPEPGELWDSAYVGVHAGYARMRSTYVNPTQGVLPDRQSDDGYSFGAQIGRRWQDGPVVVGLELEADFPQVPNQQVDAFSTGTPIFQLDVRARGRVKGQLGFASGPLLVYGTAGLEQAAFRRGLTPGFAICNPGCVFNPTGPTQFETRYYNGFLLGLGAAYAFADDLSIEVEGIRTAYRTSGTLAGDFHPRSSLGLTVRLNQSIR